MTTELVIETPKPTLPALPIVRLRGLAPLALNYLIAQILVAAQSRGTSPALISRTTIPTATLRGHGVDLGRMLSWECDADSLPSIVKKVLQIAAVHPMSTLIVKDHPELDRATEEHLIASGFTLLYA